MYDPSMGVMVMCTLTFVWHDRKPVFFRGCGCEAERVLVPTVLLLLFWFGVVAEAAKTYSCQMLLAGRQVRIDVFGIIAA